MDIRKKINFDREGLEKYGPITIVAFGDSVTHGAVASGEINFETVYWNRLKQKINAVRNYMPVNVINSGIGGINAKESIPLTESRVLAHNPDLVIVCFGLNDINCELEVYLDSLKQIFKKCIDFGTEVIFMTPNMLNTYVADDVAEVYREYSKKTADYQNGGRMDLYMESAVKLAKEMNVTVCDCYAKWKELAKTQDTTMLLANRINHPTKEMHELFANCLFETIFGKGEIEANETASTMTKEA
ncbi:MAG: GDSL family lipase [Clostridia bacterium]|nr:GDSL family lipase [Clostridia bacterium]